MRAAVLACLLAAPALGGTPLTADAFAAHVGTDTVTCVYSTGERGKADYGPDRTLRWAFEGDPLLRRHLVCPKRRGSGSSTPIERRETGRTSDPLACPGPDVGV